jgi:hypothetical protein
VLKRPLRPCPLIRREIGLLHSPAEILREEKLRKSAKEGKAHY